jgi:hypothetical protein
VYPESIALRRMISAVSSGTLTFGSSAVHLPKMQVSPERLNATLVLLIFTPIPSKIEWLRGQDSNLRPLDYESGALPTELPRDLLLRCFLFNAVLLALFWILEQEIFNPRVWDMVFYGHLGDTGLCESGLLDYRSAAADILEKLIYVHGESIEPFTIYGQAFFTAKSIDFLT